MKKLLAACLILLALVACNSPSSMNEGVSLTTQAVQSTLLKSYWHVWSSDGEKGYTGMRYMPRQFVAGVDTVTERGPQTVSNPAKYANWDMLVTRNYLGFTPRTGPLTVLTLNRAATVAVIWKGSPTNLASWLSSWTRGQDVIIEGRTYPVYEKLFSGGTVTLGGPEYKTDGVYTVLLAEQGGVPSTAKAIAPNKPCPSSRHDAYTTRGPDGRTYATWHPQIDPVYWCYFGHSHGSDPALFAGGLKPVFNFYTTQVGASEQHEHFKNLVWNENGYSIMMTPHMGSSGQGRLCARFHTLDIAVARISDRKIMANLHFKGDFGATMVGHIHGGVEKFYPLDTTGADCTAPKQARAEGTHGSIIAKAQAGYEPWSADPRYDVFGIQSIPVFITDSPVELVNIAENGDGSPALQNGFAIYQSAFRFATGEIVFTNKGNPPFSIDASQAAASGTFYTDYTGRKLVSSTTPGAVRQYLDPSLKLSTMNLSRAYYSMDAWRGAYVSSETLLIRPDMNLESALRAPN